MLTHRWVVAHVRVESLPGCLVNHEICALKGNVHCELCRIAAIESPEAFRFENKQAAVEGTRVWAPMHL